MPATAAAATSSTLGGVQVLVAVPATPSVTAGPPSPEPTPDLTPDVTASPAPNPTASPTDAPLPPLPAPQTSAPAPATPSSSAGPTSTATPPDSGAAGPLPLTGTDLAALLLLGLLLLAAGALLSTAYRAHLGPGGTPGTSRHGRTR